MENTLENKAKFFALYWGIKAMRCKTFNATTGHGLSGLMNVDVNSETIKENWFLELKPLSSISDEDLEYIRPLVGYDNTPLGIGLVKRFLTVLWMDSDDINYFAITDTRPTLKVLAIIDFLRSRGYALPWMCLSVEELINRGWVKLKGETR